MVLTLSFSVLAFHILIGNRIESAQANSTTLNQIGAPTQESDKPAEQVYSNIRALKGFPASQISGAMDFMSAALGVNCAYCHSSSYAKDDKVAKQVARNMIKMTLDLNKTSFGGSLEVTCYTCHRGQIAPVAAPSVGLVAEPDSPRVIESSTPLPSADELIEKYITALGGKAALVKAGSMIIDAQSIDTDRRTSRAELYRKFPDKLLIISKIGRQVSREGFDGKNAWIAAGEAGAEPDPESRDRITRDAEFYPAIAIRNRYKNLIVGGAVKLEKRPAYMLIATAPDGKRERFFFDKDSGLLMRRVIITKTAMGELYTQGDFEDYRRAGLVRLPFSTKWSTPGKSYTRKTISVRLNARIGDDKFKMPEARQ